MTFRHFFAIGAVAAVFSVLACGSKDSSSSSGSTSGTSSASCCLNGSWFDCPSADASTSCFNTGDPGSCSRNAAKDPGCK